MTKEQRKVYNRNYYQKNKERLSEYKAKRYAEDSDYRINLKVARLKRKDREDN